MNPDFEPNPERSEAMNGVAEPVRKSTITRSRGCRALTASGEPCRAIGGPGGLCIAHRPGGRQHMRRIGSRGGRALGFNLEFARRIARSQRVG